MNQSPFSSSTSSESTTSRLLTRHLSPTRRRVTQSVSNTPTTPNFGISLNVTTDNNSPIANEYGNNASIQAPIRPIGTLQNIVDNYLESLLKDNTQKAYAPKVLEFKAFCDHQYSFLPPDISRYTVTSEKLYRFLFYHVFREKYTRNRQTTGFDRTDYDRVTNTYSNLFNLLERNPEGTITGMRDPENPLAEQQINTYRSAVRGYFNKQVDHGAQSLVWEQVQTSAVKRLLSIARGRLTRIKRKNYAEKIDREVTPFQSFKCISEVELAFWLQGCRVDTRLTGEVRGRTSGVSTRKTFCALRNRFNLLMNFSAILRNESLILAELSDCQLLDVPRRADHDPMQVFLMAIVTGKTVRSGGPKQYGRATRHKDVTQCPIGALAFYLFYRFDVNNEFDADALPDFRVNREWFDIKVLADYNGNNNTSSMTNRQYMKALKQIFRASGITESHLVHIGRVAAPVYLEFKELSPELIKILGK